jgi:hypothetical protein
MLISTQFAIEIPEPPAPTLVDASEALHTEALNSAALKSEALNDNYSLESNDLTGARAYTPSPSEEASTIDPDFDEFGDYVFDMNNPEEVEYLMELAEKTYLHPTLPPSHHALSIRAEQLARGAV